MKKLLFILSLCSILCRIHADGSLDTTFNSSGHTEFPASLFANGILVQFDTKIVVVGTSPEGYFQTVRYNNDGSIDTTFGDNGVAAASTGSTFDVILDPIGNILVGGQDQSGNFQLVKFTPNGGIDYSFGYSGSVVGPSGFCSSLSVQPDGKILAAGADNSNNCLIIRYNADGSLDTAFESGPLGFFEDVKIQVDGKIIAVGSDANGDSQLVRYTSSGMLDTTFGSSGVASGPQGPASSLAIQPDGKYIIVGHDLSNPTNTRIARFNANGTTDTSFGTSGIGTAIEGVANDVLLQADGKIILIGQNDTDGILARYTDTGSLDISFGINGITTLSGSFQCGALDNDGNILVAGLNPHCSIMQVSRYTGSQSLSTMINGPILAPEGSIEFTGIAQSPSVIYFFLDGVLVDGTTTIDDSNDWSLTTTISSPGLYTARIVARYTDGNTNTTHAKQLRVCAA